MRFFYFFLCKYMTVVPACKGRSLLILGAESTARYHSSHFLRWLMVQPYQIWQGEIRRKEKKQKKVGQKMCFHGYKHKQAVFTELTGWKRQIEEVPETCRFISALFFCGLSLMGIHAAWGPFSCCPLSMQLYKQSIHTQGEVNSTCSFKSAGHLGIWLLLQVRVQSDWTLGELDKAQSIFCDKRFTHFIRPGFHEMTPK